MKIFVYSPQREISQIISDHLSSKGNYSIAFESSSDLSALMNNMQKGPELLILDYLTFNHDIFNIYTHLKKKRIVLPVIFYNDPCLTRNTRTNHWKSVFQLTQPESVKRKMEKYEVVFNDLEELITAEEFMPYISLLQPPQKVPETLIKDRYTLQYIKDNSDDCIKTFKERNKLPYNLYYLLSLLQKNKDMPLTVESILELYEKDGKKITAKSLKVLISKLKSCIRKDKECSFLIYTENKTYRFVRYKY